MTTAASAERRTEANPVLSIAEVTDTLVAEGKMTGAIRITNTVSPLTLTADIRERTRAS